MADLTDELRVLGMERKKRRDQDTILSEFARTEWVVYLRPGKKVLVDNVHGKVYLRLLEEMHEKVSAQKFDFKVPTTVALNEAAIGCTDQRPVITLANDRKLYDIAMNVESDMAFVTHNEGNNPRQIDGRILFVRTTTREKVREISLGLGCGARGVAVMGRYIYVSVVKYGDGVDATGHVAKFSLEQVDSTPVACIGGDDLKSPDGLAIGPGGDLYVLDTSSHSVLVFGHDGELKRSWGSFGKEPGEFHLPNSIATSEDEVFVTDWGSDRVQVFKLDGTFVRQWGSAGANDGQFAYPRGVKVLGPLVYVADCFNHRLQVFNRDGNFVCSFDGFSLPCGIEIAGGRVFVCNMLDRSIRACTG